MKFLQWLMTNLIAQISNWMMLLSQNSCRMRCNVISRGFYADLAIYLHKVYLGGTKQRSVEERNYISTGQSATNG